MSITRNQPSNNFSINEEHSSIVESQDKFLLQKSTLYVGTSFLQDPEYSSLFHIDNLAKNGEFLMNTPLKTIRKNETLFWTFLLYPYLVPFFLVSISLLFTTKNFTFELVSFYLLSSIAALFSSVYFKNRTFLTVKNPTTLQSVEVPLLWILYHNLQFKSKYQKKLWLIVNIFTHTYNKTSFFHYKNLIPDLKKLIDEAQQDLDKSFSEHI